MNLLWIVVLVGCVCAQRTINIGVQYSALKGVYAPNGAWIKPACELWQKYMNDNGGIGGLGIYPIFKFIDVQSNTALVPNATRALIQWGADILMGPEGVMVDSVLAITSPLNIPVMAVVTGSASTFICTPPLLPPCTSTDGSKRFNNVYSALTPAADYFSILMSDLAVRRIAKTVAIMYSTLGANAETCIGAITHAANNRINVLGTYSINAVANNTVQLSQIDIYLRLMADLSPDVYVVCDLSHCAYILLKMVEYGYTPKTLAMFECANQYTTLKDQVGTALQYVISPVQWHPYAQGYNFVDRGIKLANGASCCAQFSGSAELARQLLNQTSLPFSLSPMVGPIMMALKTIEFGVTSTNSTNGLAVSSVFERAHFTTVGGPLMYDSTGRDVDKTMILVQIQADYTQEIISPENTATVLPIYAIPQWNERTYYPTTYKTLSEQTFIVLASVSTILAFLIGLLLVLYRQEKIIKGASLLFSCCTLVGYLAILWSLIYTWPTDNNTTTCSLRIPFLLISYLLCYMPLFAKTWRIAYIFNQSQIRRELVTDIDVARYMALGSIPLITILILWCVIDPLKPALLVTDVLRPSLNIYVCTNSSIGWYIALGIVIGLYTVYGLYLSHRVRHAYSVFNEASSIRMCLAAFVFGVAVVSVFNDSYGKLMASLYFLLTFSMGVLYYSKMRYVFELWMGWEHEVTLFASEQPDARISELVVQKYGSRQPKADTTMDKSVLDEAPPTRMLFEKSTKSSPPMPTHKVGR